MLSHNFIAIVMLFPVFAVVLVLLADIVLSCFRWCFVRVEDYFQDRFIKKILGNIERLERIAASEEKAVAA